VRQVTAGAFNIGSAAAWLPDGRSVVVSANPDADADYNPLESDLYRVTVESGTFERLTDRAGPDRNPVLSPDGRQVAYLGFDDRKLGYHNARLHVLRLSDQSVRELTSGLDASVDDVHWLSDREIAFSFDARGITQVASVDAGGGDVRVLADDLGGTAMGRPYTGGAMSAAAGRDRPRQVAGNDFAQRGLAGAPRAGAD
jgi:Tol biopolymer transport system component